MERRLREVPRPRQRTRRAPHCKEHRQPRRASTPFAATTSACSATPRAGPLSLPIHGEYLDWPVGYLPGDRLADFWHLEEAKPGTQDFYFIPRRQRTQKPHARQRLRPEQHVPPRLRCFDCHQVHSNRNPSNLIATGNAALPQLPHKGQSRGPEGHRLRAHPPRGQTARAASAPPATCRKSPRHSQQAGRRHLRRQPHLPLSLAYAHGDTPASPIPASTATRTRQMPGLQTQLRSWTSASPWRVAN